MGPVHVVVLVVDISVGVAVGCDVAVKAPVLSSNLFEQPRGRATRNAVNGVVPYLRRTVHGAHVSMKEIKPGTSCFCSVLCVCVLYGWPLRFVVRPLFHADVYTKTQTQHATRNYVRAHEPRDFALFNASLERKQVRINEVLLTNIGRKVVTGVRLPSFGGVLH